MHDILQALKAKRESKRLDFKSRFDVSGPQEWCELLKDIVAMANSGGGLILIGCNNDGSASKIDVQGVINLDPAKLSDQIRSYTGEDFDNFEIKDAKKGRHPVAIIQVGSTESPIVFTRPGTYALPDGKQQKTAFSVGTVYFRHGAKSEPGTSKDLRKFIDQFISNYKRKIFGDVRKVIDAPAGHEVRVLPPNVIETHDASATPIRKVDDPSAPAYRFVPSDDN